jgi:Galactose mutarotase and related enzymes
MIYTIEQYPIQVKVDSLGAQLCSIKNLETGKEYIYQKNPDVWAWHAPIMFPQCGNFPDGYDYEGQHYQFPNHGFLRDQEFSFKGNTFTFTSNDENYKMYPFRFRAKISFIINGKSVKQQARIDNLDEKDMPYSIGFHTGYIMHYPTLSSTLLGDIKFTDEYLSSIKRYFEPTPHKLYLEDEERKISITTGDYSTLLVWSHPKGKDHMVCVEPRIDTDKANNGYPFGRILKAGHTKYFSQVIEIIK